MLVSRGGQENGEWIGGGAKTETLKRECTPPARWLRRNTTLFLTRLFFRASQALFVYIRSMQSWLYYMTELTVEAREVDFVYENHIRHSDGSRSVSYDVESLTVLLPRFRRCVSVESFLAPHRWN